MTTENIIFLIIFLIMEVALVAYYVIKLKKLKNCRSCDALILDVKRSLAKGGRIADVEYTLDEKKMNETMTADFRFKRGKHIKLYFEEGLSRPIVEPPMILLYLFTSFVIIYFMSCIAPLFH